MSVSEAAPIVAVVVFPGSNDDRDAAWRSSASARSARASGTPTRRCRRTAAVVLPGGFSYGDYLRCGAIARFSPVMRAVATFAADGGLVLGICNGFQILTEAGLLPGVLRPNASLSFVCRDVALVVEQRRDAVHVALRGAAAAAIPSSTARAAGSRTTSCSRSSRRNGQIVLRYARARIRTGRSATSRASRTRRETCSASCRIRSTRSIRCSARPTGR